MADLTEAASRKAGLPETAPVDPDEPTTPRPDLRPDHGDIGVLESGRTDPRAVRVRVGPASRLGPDADLLVAPGDADVVGLEILGRDRFRLAAGQGTGTAPTRLLLLAGPPARDGSTPVEVVVEGWRVELEVELDSRVALRERASRGRRGAARSGPVEVRAIIPGRVVALAVASGDEVAAGAQLLTVEAMKMQNEVRAPRAGKVARLLVGAGQTIEVGDVLVVLE